MSIPPIHIVSGADSLSDLVKRIADRDQTAFSRLYYLLVRPVFAQVCESLGSPAGAVPVTRAVFVEVWRLAPVSDARCDDALAWITGIAARRACDKLRETDRQLPAGGPDHDGHSREVVAALGAEPPAAADLGHTPPSAWGDDKAT